MDIVFNCPHCGLSLEVDQDAAGQQFDCPTCQKQVTVPAAAAVPFTCPFGHRMAALQICKMYAAP